MNIEELSKSQLLLLTVMVNFIVSIATGILTVSLLDQAPIQVTQGVDRVVERTIQAVASPVQTSNPIVSNPIKTIANVVSPQPPAPTPEQQLTAAVGDVSSRTVLIYRGATTSPAIAYGAYLPTQKSVATATVKGLPKEAMIAFNDGSVVRASLSKSTATVTIYGFADDATLPKAPAAGLVAASKLKQGQTVIALTKDSAAITGIISKVNASSIETTLTGVPVGAGVVGTDGFILGIGSITPGVLIPADTITTLLQAPATAT
ncbi:MAG TPA: hypothetical protein VN086_01795 [Candidatus Paceibacterota bacterium]|nr:hypothetical protein [Candidatus Paceibacterota bacterium]